MSRGNIYRYKSGNYLEMAQGLGVLYNHFYKILEEDRKVVL
jgi:hypothetical protein